MRRQLPFRSPVRSYDSLKKDRSAKWHFDKRWPNGTDHEKQRPGPVGLDAALN